jgi:hypothetical protein
VCWVLSIRDTSARVYTTNQVLTNKNLNPLMPFLDDDDGDIMAPDRAMAVYFDSATYMRVAAVMV